MTVSSLVPVNNYTGNSYSKKFDFDFLIEKESELKVYLINASGYSILLENGIDYSINEIGNPNGSYITFPLSSSKYEVLSSDEKLSLALDLVIKQENEFKNSLYFNFDVLEWTFDYIIRILQIFSRRFERAVLVTEGTDITPAELLNNIEKSESASKAYSEISKAYSISAEGYSEVSKNHSDVAKSHSDNAKKEAEKAEEQAEIAVQKAREIGTVTFLPVSFLYGNECAEELPCYAEWICDGRELNSGDYSGFVTKYLDSGVFSVCRYEDYNAEILLNGYCKKFAVNPFIYNRSQFSVVGSPVISDDGIASGFDNSNYIQAIQLKHLANKSWTIKTKWINQGKTGTSSVNVFYDMGSYRAWGSISFSTALKQLAFFSRTGTKDDTNNEKAWAVKYLSDIPNYIIASISFDIKTGTYTAKADWGGGEVLIGTYTPTTENKQLYMINNFPDKYVRIGTGSDNEYNKNATDLNEFNVIVFDNDIDAVNTFRLPFYKHIDEFNRKTDLDLGNLSDTGKKVIDGQWVQSVKDLSTATAVGTYTIDLADYLPVDDYSYEIYINADAYTDSNVVKTYISAMNNDMTTSKITLLWGASYARQNTNIARVIADKTRKITIQHELGKWSGFNLKAIGYRRLGTNS